MTTSYNRSLSTDFGNNLRPDQLINEINLNTSINPLCLTVKNTNSQPDLVAITFNSDLNGSEIVTLDNIINNHIPFTSPQIVICPTGANNTTLTLTSNQTQDRTIILPDADDELTCVNHSQTLLNKTISDPTNTIGANELRTTGQSVVLDTATPPSAGQILQTISPTSATWQTLSKKCDIYYNPASETVVTNSWTDVPLNIERIKDSDFAHQTNGTEITINTTDNYLIIARCSTYIPNGNSRTNTQMRLALNTGSGYSTIPGTFGYMYNRNSSQGYNTVTVSAILQLNMSDKIKMQVMIFSGNGPINLVSEGSSITIIKA
tara:strand:+ start:893 stop:1852 length:960 start_codon:yes stop_codon:yes gene_type:complete